MAYDKDNSKSDKRVYLYEMNSMDFLQREEIKKLFGPFDLVLVDGDHNYHTVLTELRSLHAKGWIHEHTLIVCDDYYGKCSKKDYFITEHGNDSQRGNPLLGEPVKLSKQGVKPAIDEFIKETDVNWHLMSSKEIEPCLIWDSDAILIDIKFSKNNNYFRDAKLITKLKSKKQGHELKAKLGLYDSQLPSFNN